MLRKEEMNNGLQSFKWGCLLAIMVILASASFGYLFPGALTMEGMDPQVTKVEAAWTALIAFTLLCPAFLKGIFAYRKMVGEAVPDFP